MTDQQFDVIIVGAGFGGIGAAIQLKRLGFENFVILDRDDDLGGTWHVNHYPGLTVDIVREFPLGTRSALEFDAWLTDRAGTRFRIRGVNVVEVRDGRFVSVRSYEDPPMAE